MSKFGAKTYGRKHDCRLTPALDQIILDKGDSKASSAKMSVAAVHRWGMTSFTSLRKAAQSNGQPDGANDGPVSSDAKAANPSLDDDPFSFDVDHDETLSSSSKSASSRLHGSALDPGQASSRPLPPKPKKFFKSRNTSCTSSPLASQTSARAVAQFDRLRTSGSNSVASKSKDKNEPVSKVGISWGPDDNVDFRCVKLEKSSRAAGLSRDHPITSSLSSGPSTVAPLTVAPVMAAAMTVAPSASLPLTAAPHMSASVTATTLPALQGLPTPSSFFADESVKGSEPGDGNEHSSFHAPPAMRTYSRKRNPGAPAETPGVVIPVKRTATAVGVSDTLVSGLVLVVPSTNVGMTCVTDVSEVASSSETSFPGEVASTSETVAANLSPTDTKMEDEPPVNLQRTGAEASNSPLPSSQDSELLSVTGDGTSQGSITDSQESTPAFQNLPSSSQEDAVKPSEPKASSSRCIFKSKKIFQSPKKPKAVYKLRHWQTPDAEEDLEVTEAAQDRNKLAEEFDADAFSDNALTREVHQPSQPWKDAVTSVKCPRKARELYTVVRNVKKAYQCHESGETQEFNDDIEYLLEGVQPGNPIGARCLSVVGLASKCMVPAFRMHLRAHGIVCKFFSALTDAPSDPSLSLCTATLFFVLSQDRLTMDLDASTLSLMLQLFESDPQQGEGGLTTPRSSSSELIERHREKVQQLCEQMQQKGHAKHLNLNRVNTGTLALETLLSLTSRRAGEWFKEELRLQGGLTHIVNTVSECLSYFGEGVTVLENPTDFKLEKLKKIDRCSRVLENVTYMNPDNQRYLLDFKGSLMVASYVRLLLLCQSSLLVHPVLNEPTTGTGGTKMGEGQITSVVLQSLRGPGAVFFSCLLSVLRVLLNMTHESLLGSKVVGSQPGLLAAILLCILQVPKAVPTEQRFDLLVLSLGLLINLVEHCEENRERLANTQTVGSFESVCDQMEMPAFNALMDLFTDKVEAAHQSEEQANELLSNQEKKMKASLEPLKGEPLPTSQQSALTQADDLEETLMKALQKAGKHMEHSIVCAYIALLLGCAVQNNKELAEKLREYAPEGKFQPLVEALKKFHNFINLTGVLGNRATKSMQCVIKVLEDS
uniref:WAPL domain-containing protein n=1 Tax=Rhipicephalus pulchellus TaxID=72859 RepID=L7MBA9_RHIPC